MLRGVAQSAALQRTKVGAQARIYLDANANAPIVPSVRAAVLEALDTGANPSSAHAAGEDARVMLTMARDAVVGLCDGLFPEDVIFTSGCTEANNTLVATAKALSATLVTSSVEHPSVLRPAEAFAASGGALRIVDVDKDGRLDLAHLSAVLAATSGLIVLSIQTANSETGVIQPIKEIAVIVDKYPEILFHSDAAQALGKIHLELGRGRGPDVYSVSGHKLHGPMGVGALLLREGEERLRSMILGGDQERGLRAGTQPLPLIAGFGAACRARADALAHDVALMSTLRDRLEAAVRDALPSVIVNGKGAPRLPNTSNLRFPGLDAMSLVAQLDAEGVLASQGSACHSQRPEPSSVLMAMGLSETEAFASIRFSVSPLNTEAEIDLAAELIVAACRYLGMSA